MIIRLTSTNVVTGTIKIMNIFIHQKRQTYTRYIKSNTRNYNTTYIHRVQKKGATLFCAITLPNPNRSSNFFYRHTHQ